MLIYWEIEYNIKFCLQSKNILLAQMQEDTNTQGNSREESFVCLFFISQDFIFTLVW